MSEKKNIYEKLMAIQCELECPKNQYNAFGAFKYRSCEDILEAVKPLCKKYKAGLRLSDFVVPHGDRFYIQATAELYDTETITPSYVFACGFAREAASKKGMDEAQITGAASSYARKYALNGLFCIDDTKDADYHNNRNEANIKTEEKKKTYKNFEFLKEMGEIKKELCKLTDSDYLYKKELGGKGYEHSNEIEPPKQKAALAYFQKILEKARNDNT